MSLLRKKTADPTDPAAEEGEVVAGASLDRSEGGPETDGSMAPADPAPVGKGRPTPKRRESERRRGPIAPPPKSQREAYKRSKRPGGKKLTKDERKAISGERRERMMSGDSAYVLPRDKGEVRAYVRNLVDARRNLAGLLLPIALLSFVTLIIPNPVVGEFGPIVLMVLILAAVIDSYIFGRRMGRKVRAEFPKGDKSGQSTKSSALGFYAFNRACLIRKWRIPRPQVKRGDIVD